MYATNSYIIPGCQDKSHQSTWPARALKRVAMRVTDWGAAHGRSTNGLLKWYL